MREIAAFPLGSVLLPGQLLPLQVFEPRYRVLLFDLRDEDPAEFMVVLIERGSEVGGGDVRSEVGCVARIIERQDLPDGRSLVLLVGTEPVRVTGWLPEDPYPVAAVEPVRVPGGPGASVVELSAVEDLTDLAREVGSMASQLGAPPWPDESVLADDGVERMWQLAMAAPLATLDRQSLLGEADPARRAELLAGFLSEQRELLGARLEWGGAGGGEEA